MDAYKWNKVETKWYLVMLIRFVVYAMCDVLCTMYSVEINISANDARSNLPVINTEQRPQNNIIIWLCDFNFVIRTKPFKRPVFTIALSCPCFINKYIYVHLK